MLSSQEEQAERQRVFAQDQSLRGSTFHQHALADANTPQGRFSAHAAAFVIGSKPDVASAYTAAGAHQADPCGLEPPLGYAINELEPVVSPPPVAQATGGAPSGFDVAAPPLSQSGDPAGDFPSPPDTSPSVDAGSPPRSYRRY